MSADVIDFASESIDIDKFSGHIIKVMASLTLAQRVELFGRLKHEYCDYCGSLTGSEVLCQCSNDE